jgi:imidazolonepropionase-like amidohydrolase
MKLPVRPCALPLERSKRLSTHSVIDIPVSTMFAQNSRFPRLKVWSAALLAGACMCGPAWAAGDSKLAIKAARILPAPGAEPIEKGVIVIEGGKIAAMGGPETKIPWDAPVLDASKWTAFPGFVEAHASRGMDRPNEAVDVAPFLSVRDSVDPVNFYFEDSLRWGVTTINVQHGADCVVGAQGMIVKPFGLTIEEMTVRPSSGLKLSAAPKRGLSSATQAQALRRVFTELRQHLEKLVQEKREGSDRARREALFQGRDLTGENAKGRPMAGSAWKVEGLDLVPRGEIDEKQEPLLDLVEGRMAAFFYCNRAMEVRLALEIARDNGFLARTVLVLAGDSWKAADAVAEAGTPVVWVGPVVVTERDIVTGEEQKHFAVGELAKRKIRFALSSSNSTNESLWYQAALCVGQGLPREQALEAVTSAPAEMLGLGNRVGKLAVGMDADVLLFSGDPLSSQAWVEKVVLGGAEVYDRATDIRNKHLLEGLAPDGTDAMGAEPEKPHVHDEITGDEHDKDKQGSDKDKSKEKSDSGKGGGEKDGKQFGALPSTSGRDDGGAA